MWIEPRLYNISLQAITHLSIDMCILINTVCANMVLRFWSNEVFPSPSAAQDWSHLESTRCRALVTHLLRLTSKTTESRTCWGMLVIYYIYILINCLACLNIILFTWYYILFPTCQVRVVRFYQSCSPPLPRLAVLLLLLLFLASSSSSASSSNFSSTMSASTYLPSSVCTAGPQPGTCPAQCAPLDLNGQIECQKICQKIGQIECQMECQKICQNICQKICQVECQKLCQIECQKICQIESQKICQKICQIECQKVCQIECQIDCQKVCQIECQKICE